MLDTIDWKEPDYVAVFKARANRLANIRREPSLLPALKAHYRNCSPAVFINDWGVTFDPRNVERGLPSYIPFILFPKQIERIDWLVAHWRSQKPGLTEKSRDTGLSWLAVATACTLCLNFKGMAIGVGSRKEEYVDKLDSPKSLFFKARMLADNLPVEFQDGWQQSRDAPYMRIKFPGTGSVISGEAGDNIGRGDRCGIYLVDEAAHLERPALIEASLSQTTNCRIDMSSVAGMANPFAQKRHSGKIDVFTMHWTDDPRKDAAWYAKQVEELDPITVAQEIDINYSASVEGVLIPSAWILAATDAHLKLNIDVTGESMAALDVADEGADTNALCGGKGILVDVLEEWSGIGSDLFKTAERAFNICDDHGYRKLRFDSDGIGASVRADGRVINELRAAANKPAIIVEPFRGSASVRNPTRQDVPGRTNEDYFLNAKAQAWWALRLRFQRTYRAIVHGVVAPHDELISISSKLRLYARLLVELAQPTYDRNAVGKVFVDKKPEGTKSPNLADGVMIRFAGPTRTGLHVSGAALQRFAA